MKKYNIEDITVVIADPNRQLRTSLKGVLGQHGFRGIQDAATAPVLEDILRNKTPDLILSDINMPDGNVCEIINKLRHNTIGNNPYAAVILFTDQGLEDVIGMASQAGVDDIQVKPVVAAKIIKRMEYLVEKRKPFVVTTDYVGPDRRSKPRPGTQQIEQIIAPNSIALKANGQFKPDQFRLQIEQTTWDINAQKIERHVFQVSYLVDHILPAFTSGQITRESLQMVARLRQVSRDIVNRLEDSDFGHIANLASTLETVANSLWRSGTDPKKKDLNLLPELAAALNATMKTKGAAASVAKKIQSSIEEKYNF